LQSGEDEFEQTNRNDRKRINKFENSQYYIMPISNDENELNQYMGNQQIFISEQEINNDQQFNANELNNFNMKKG
jgi:hypothetical protein